VRGGTLPGDVVWTGQQGLAAYLVVNNDLDVPPGVTWTISDSLNIQFDYGLGAQIEGNLAVNGTAESPRHLLRPSAFYLPVAGDWAGLTFAAGSQGSLTHAEVAFAQTGLTIAGDVAVYTSTVTASAGDGIVVQPGGTLALHHATLAANGGLGLNNQSGVCLDARHTWWGHTSGPLDDFAGVDACGQSGTNSWFKAMGSAPMFSTHPG
jgi:hypothetical protein